MAKTKKNQTWAPVLLLVFVPFLAILFSSFVLYRGVLNYLATSQYFNVRALKVEGIADSRYVDLMKKEILGVNIFRIDMSKLSGRIKQRFPTFYSVTVSRVLPSELSIVAKERLPVAIIKKGAPYVLDEEGVVLMELASEKDMALPLIVGVEEKIPKMKAGAEVKGGLLRKSLLLAKALRLKRLGVRPVKIDASDPAHPFFYLGEGVQVKVRDKDYETQLEILPAIIKSLGSDLGLVSYIDLRPREPVVAMREKDAKIKKP